MTIENAKLLTGKLQHFRRKVFKNSRRVHSGFGPDTHVMLGSLFKIPMNTTNRELDKMGQRAILREERIHEPGVQPFDFL